MTAFGTHGVEFSVEAAFGYDPMNTSPVWTDISEYVSKIVIRRGARSHPKRKIVAGRMTITLDNSDDRFDPNNSNSVYDPDVVLSVPFRVRAIYDAVTYPMMRGFVQEWKVQYKAKGHVSKCVVTVVDGLQLINQQNLWDAALLGGGSGPGVAEVITDVLILADWPPAWQTLDSTLTITGGLSDGLGKQALAFLKQVVTSSAGYFFAAADGDMIYHNRIHHAGGATSKGTFGAETTRLPYSEYVPKYNDDTLFNEIVMVNTFAGDTEETRTQADDAASITANGIRTQSAAATHRNANEALNVAEWDVAAYKEMQTRIVELRVLPAADPAALFPVILDVDLRDSIGVRTTPKGGGSELNQQVAVETIRHTITVDRWLTVYGCHPLAAIETEEFWVLGTSELGTEARLA